MKDMVRIASEGLSLKESKHHRITFHLLTYIRSKMFQKLMVVRGYGSSEDFHPVVMG